MPYSSGAAFNYRGEDGAAYHALRKLPAAAEQWVAQVRAEKIQPYIRAADHVFEYGVGFGWNLMAVQCARRCGFDVAPGLRAIVESRGIEFRNDLSAIAPETFDVVLAHHTLEHLASPLEGARRMLELAKPAGRILLFVPFERERKYTCYDRANKAHHLYSWTSHSFRNLIATAGARIENVAIQRFRFDRIAALLTFKVRGTFSIYRVLRATVRFAFPEYEICLLSLKK